jgi:hypothetical protein
MLELSYTIPNQQPRNTAKELSEIVGAEMMLDELICWLSHDQLNSFLSDFACHLENGDFV